MRVWVAGVCVTDADARVRLSRGGLEGLLGESPVAGLRLPGRPGVLPVVRPGGAPEPIVGSVGLVACSVDDWRRLFGRVSRGGFDVVVEFGGVRCVLPCRLVGSPSWPERDCDCWVELVLRVVAEGGVWRQVVPPTSGSVTVTNTGDVAVYPTVVWRGAGGQVVMPSGNTITLPRVSAERRVDFDPVESLLVTDVDGLTDDVVWKQVRASGFPEGVPPGGEGTYRLPEGATLSYALGWLDPRKAEEIV